MSTNPEWSSMLKLRMIENRGILAVCHTCGRVLYQSTQKGVINRFVALNAAINHYNAFEFHQTSVVILSKKDEEIFSTEKLEDDTAKKIRFGEQDPQVYAVLNSRKC